MNSLSQLPLWRSVMFVPANVEKFVSKATGRGADAILLDLEDSIAPADKENARRALTAAVATVSVGPADVGVRINRPLTQAVRDIEAAVIPGVSFLALPKVENAAHIRLLAEAVSDLENERGLTAGGIKFLAYIESASSFFRMEEIANAHPRVAALTVGSEDFSSSCEFEPSAETLFMPKQMGLIAARAAGILPVGFIGSVSNFSDTEGFRQVIRRSRSMGFVCGFAIHPAQVAILNEEFGPTAEEISYAREIIAASMAIDNGGPGAFTFRGKMIDKPIIERAERLIARAEAIQRRQFAA